MKSLCSIGVLTLIASVSMPIFAAESNKDLLDLSLDDLLDIKVDTVSVLKSPWRYQPGTMTLLTADDLKALGARNLMEALEFVPGTSFGVDVLGVISLSFRGQWAHEGKVLLLLDDMPLNDLMYGNLNLAKHYPIEQIDRIEVLRGAGSAKYGGNAQLAVIRIYSKKVEDRFFEANITAEFVDNAGLGNGITLTGGAPFDGGSFMISSHVSRDQWSGQFWRDANGASIDMSKFSEFSADNLIGRLDWANFHLRSFFDNHHSETPQFFGTFHNGEAENFTSTNLSASYDWAVSDRFTLSPKYSHRSQHDWYLDRDPVLAPPTFIDFTLPMTKDTINLDMHYMLSAWSLQSGVESWYEYGKCNSPGRTFRNCATFFNGAEDVSYRGKAAYTQGDWTEGPWAVSLGLRYSDHNYAGESFVPRAALVFKQDDWHLKLNYGQAYREPDVLVIADATDQHVKSETTTQKEVEFGWRPTQDWFGTLSVFSMEVDNSLIYASSDTSYTNYQPVETRGVETEWRWRSGTKQAHLTYDWYQSASAPNAKYAVTGHDGLNIGVPRSKATASMDYGLPGTHWNLQASLIWYGITYANTFDGYGISVQSISSQTFLNAQARYQRKDWEVAVGVYDLANEGRLYPQPYLDSSTPYPGPGRQLWSKLTLRW